MSDNPSEIDNGKGFSFPRSNPEMVRTRVLRHFQRNPVVWEPEELAIVDDVMAKCGSSFDTMHLVDLVRRLPEKTVRDIALRCKWLIRKRKSKQIYKGCISRRKTKARKETVNVRSSANTPGYCTEDPSLCTKDNTYNVDTGQLLTQNAEALEQISTNMRVHQLQSLHENVGLFRQSRDNIYKLLNKLNERQDIMKNLPPLPVELDEDLTKVVLPEARVPNLKPMNHGQRLPQHYFGSVPAVNGTIL